MPLFTILTLFPEALEPYLEAGILGVARRAGAVDVRLVDFRDWTRDRHRSVDDRPFGGGPGMVLKPEPIAECTEWIEERFGPHRRIALCPSGPVFRQATAAELTRAERVLLLCGRYEGIDQRVFDVLGFEPLSIGEFVLAGGELAALCIVEASARLVPGVLGDERSAVEDSWSSDPTRPDLDHPCWTRPRVFRGRAVPEVLLGGDHEAIRRFREEEARRRTTARRPPAPADSDHDSVRGGAPRLPNETCT